MKRELKPPVLLVSNTSASENYIITDTEGYKSNSDYPVPMLVQHTEDILKNYIGWYCGGSFALQICFLVNWIFR